MTATIEMPNRVRNLPRNDAGYPVPWFVATIEGKPDFRIIREGGIVQAFAERLCWICGQKRPKKQPDAFTIGPMCALNRISAEPPSHRDCAIYAAQACPFLANPKKRRREGHMPDELGEVAGQMIRRNPGVALVWLSRNWHPVSDGRGGALFNVGDAVEVLWFAESREATRAEVLDSIGSGLPILSEMAEQDGPEAMTMLARQHSEALELIPA